MTLTLQVVGFKKEEALSLSLEVEDDSHTKSIRNLNPQGVFVWFPYWA